MASLKLRQRIARLHPFIWVGAAAIVAGVIAWPLGGWDTVVLESTKVPAVPPSSVVAGQQFSVQVDAAEITRAHPDGSTEPDGGWEYLILTMAVTNMTDQTQLSINLGDGYFGIVTIDDGVAGWGASAVDSSGYESSPDSYLVADDTYLPDLQPGLSMPIRMVFEVPTDTWHAGDEITVGIIDRVPYGRSLSTGTGYRNPHAIAVVTLVLDGDVVEAGAET